MKLDFNHIQSAHCENGVTSNLLRHHGLDLDEPMVFGIGSGIFYIHLPFLKINNAPTTSYRPMPGLIFKRTSKALGVKFDRLKFKNEVEATQALDRKLEEGTPVGLQVGVFHLSYFPKEYRFHFNAHNIVVFGKENGLYHVSDPVMETTTTLTEEEMLKVRFAKGALAPKGQMYYPTNIPDIQEEQLKIAIKKSIKKSVNQMTKIPYSLIGIKGLNKMGGKVEKYKEELGQKKASLYLGQLIRMQEEIGTGGGGFRFIYAAYLQKSTKYWDFDELHEASELFTKSGDTLRSFAMQCAGLYKGRLTSQEEYTKAGDFLREASRIEKEAFHKLKKINWK